MSFTDPAYHGVFLVAENTFFVKTSCNHIHTRATPWEVPWEVHAVFYHTPLPSGLQKVPDPPGHWYEAQLLHYGISSCKVKPTAKIRLFDALNDGNGNLTVPKEITDIEILLRKQWRRADRRCKKAAEKEFDNSNLADKTESNERTHSSTKRKSLEHENNGMKTPEPARKKKRSKDKDTDASRDVSRSANGKTSKRRSSSAAKDHKDKAELTPNTTKPKSNEDDPVKYGSPPP